MFIKAKMELKKVHPEFGSSHFSAISKKHSPFIFKLMGRLNIYITMVWGKKQ